MLENIVSIRDWNDVTKMVSFASMEESAMMRTRKSATQAFCSYYSTKIEEAIHEQFCPDVLLTSFSTNSDWLEILAFARGAIPVRTASSKPDQFPIAIFNAMPGIVLLASSTQTRFMTWLICFPPRPTSDASVFQDSVDLPVRLSE